MSLGEAALEGLQCQWLFEEYEYGGDGCQMKGRCWSRRVAGSVQGLWYVVNEESNVMVGWGQWPPPWNPKGSRLVKTGGVKLSQLPCEETEKSLVAQVMSSVEEKEATSTCPWLRRVMVQQNEFELGRGPSLSSVAET